MGLYTKDDFLKEYEKSGWDFSDADMKLATANPDVGMNMLTYARDYQNATNDAGRNAAHDNMEKLRQAYGGYSAGADGSGYILTGPTPTSFNYSPETDQLYSAYRKQYLREGDRQTRDVLASYANMTGGRPSTAAVSAAQQAGNYYNSQLADKIPELYQIYYNKYRQELEDTRANDQYDRNMAISEKDSEWQRQYQMAQLAASYGDYSLLKEMGINPNETNPGTSDSEWQKKYEFAKLAAAYGDYSYLRELGINPGGADTAPGTPDTTTPGTTTETPTYTPPAWAPTEGGSLSQLDKKMQIVQQLAADYPDGVVPAGDWDFYLSMGVNPGLYGYIRGN